MINKIAKEIEEVSQAQKRLYSKRISLESERQNLRIKVLLKSKQLQSITWQFNTNSVLGKDFSIVPAIFKHEKGWDKVASLCDTIYEISHFIFEIKKDVEVYLDYDDSTLIISFKTYKQGIDFINDNKLKVDFSYIHSTIRRKEKELKKFKELSKTFGIKGETRC
jgi:hypothetical protein